MARTRQATMVGLGLRLKTGFPDLFAKHGLEHRFAQFVRLTPTARRRLCRYPPFAAWLRETARLSNRCRTGEDDRAEFEMLLSDLGRIWWGFRRDEARCDGAVRIPGTRIRIERFDLDPMLKRAIPPSYEFPKDERTAREIDSTAPYTLALFVEAMGITLRRVREVCPRAHADILRFVQIIVHLRDAPFRSCSADRYVGVILMSAQDYSILDMEESLIHEYGHQILYNVMEVHALLKNPGAKKQYRLPWSGSRRDLYGYFHAYYIYLLVAMYYRRIKGRPSEEQALADRRYLQILEGLERATTDFDAALFTPTGHAFLFALRQRVRRLAGETAAGRSRTSAATRIEDRP